MASPASRKKSAKGAPLRGATCCWQRARTHHPGPSMSRLRMFSCRRRAKRDHARLFGIPYPNMLRDRSRKGSSLNLRAARASARIGLCFLRERRDAIGRLRRRLRGERNRKPVSLFHIERSCAGGAGRIKKVNLPFLISTAQPAQLEVLISIFNMFARWHVHSLK